MRAVKTGLLLVSLALMPSAAIAQEVGEPERLAAFARAATQGSLSEVLMSAMALQKTSDRRVSEHAWTMLDHHSRAIGDLADALTPDDAPLPVEPSAEQAEMLERLSRAEGEAFDAAYLEHQVEAHRSSVENFETGAGLERQPVATYAATTLPILRAHLEIAEMRLAMDPVPMPGQ